MWMARTAIVVGAVAIMGLGTLGCTNNRSDSRVAIGDVEAVALEAPDWVQGYVPQSENTMFFVGRSHLPLKGSGYTIVDERSLVQSARDDVYDQIRQRLAPITLSGHTDSAIDNAALNLGYSLVVPALASHLSEEGIYIQDNGRLDQCWILYSMPREEFLLATARLEAQWGELQELAVGIAMAENEQNLRRRAAESDAAIKAMAEDRQWARDDAIVSRDHSMAVDSDRRGLPGRRFTPKSDQ